MSHWTIPPVNKFDYWLALYHGPVTRFPVKNTQVLIDMHDSNNSVVYGQKHKVWVLIFLIRTSRTFWDQIWADLVKFSVLQQNRIVYSNSVQETLQSISSNGFGNKTVISCLFVECQTITPRYYERPDALLLSAFGLLQ